ncbi:hypothetical protein CDAR_172541 [Caerostris darwini]|uniref:Uncharacterized protein n=1 Tax=Caerostris darwini TaxID=1538125 RepID=A0AAV4MEG3_9ARAC|nr:hypothetical protein CDAR_172541 [Caerostris darwini]
METAPRRSICHRLIDVIKNNDLRAVAVPIAEQGWSRQLEKGSFGNEELMTICRDEMATFNAREVAGEVRIIDMQNVVPDIKENKKLRTTYHRKLN